MKNIARFPPKDKCTNPATALAAALRILENHEEAGEAIDYQDFFEANARIWFLILTPAEAERRLKIDPHAPACLRTNVNLSQFDKFYKVYDVKEGRLYVYRSGGSASRVVTVWMIPRDDPPQRHVAPVRSATLPPVPLHWKRASALQVNV